MAGFSLFNALSTGPLSGLPDLLRLRIGLRVAGFPRERPFAADFNRVRANAAQIEDHFREEMARDWTNFIPPLERDFTAEVGTILFEPKPTTSASEKAEQPSSEEDSDEPAVRIRRRPFAPAGASIEPVDSVEAFYDYFFSAYVHGDEEHVPDDDLNEIAERVVGQASLPTPPADEKTSALAPDSEAARRKGAFDNISARLRPVLLRFRSAVEAGEAESAKAIESILAKYVERVRSALGSKERRPPDGVGGPQEELPSEALSLDDDLAAEFPSTDGPNSEAIPPRDLAAVLVDQASVRMNKAAEKARNEVESAAANADPRAIISPILRARLNAIDEGFGKAYRDALEEERRPLRSWPDVREALKKESTVPLILLTENLRRNELRRELIAGSVQCAIGERGERFIRFSSDEASGPPPHFKRWIQNQGLPDIQKLLTKTPSGHA